MLFHDPLSLSTVLAFGLVTAFCMFLQLRLARPWLALVLTWLLCPWLYLLAEPILYSPLGFVRLVLPRLPSFLANSLRVYPTVLAKLALIPLLCVPLGLRRRAALEMGLT